MLLRLLQLAIIAVPVASYICGSLGQCRCVQDFWVICDDIKEVPFFRKSIRHHRGMMLSVDAAEGNFDAGSLRLTKGFHVTVLRVAAMPEGYCLDVMLRFPWISCLSLETTSWTATTEETTTSTINDEGSDPTKTTRDDETTAECTTSDGTDPTTSKALSISFEARVSFSMRNTATTAKTDDDSTEKPLLEVLKKSSTLFWIAITFGSSLLLLVMVITLRFLFKKRGPQEGSLMVKCCYWICQFCLCPFKCLDKIRARERPRYTHDLPVQRLDSSAIDDESVELFTR